LFGAIFWLFSPAWDAIKLTLEFDSICCFVVIDPANEGATTILAPGQMIDNFLTIPQTESLLLHCMALKTACANYSE
jgi:hypothetical protein